MTSKQLSDCVFRFIKVEFKTHLCTSILKFYNTDKKKNWVVIGISGVTCGGKTTLAKALKQRYQSSVLFCQDDYFFPNSENHIIIPELDHFNWDIITAFDMDKMRSDLERTLNSKPNGDCSVIIIEGVLVFNDEKLLKLYDKKYFLTLSYDACLERRLKRTYDPPDIPGYFEICVWPEYLKSKEEALKLNPDILIINGETNSDETFKKVSADVDELVAECKKNQETVSLCSLCSTYTEYTQDLTERINFLSMQDFL